MNVCPVRLIIRFPWKLCFSLSRPWWGNIDVRQRVAALIQRDLKAWFTGIRKGVAFFLSSRLCPRSLAGTMDSILLQRSGPPPFFVNLSLNGGFVAASKRYRAFSRPLCNDSHRKYSRVQQRRRDEPARNFASTTFCHFYIFNEFVFVCVIRNARDTSYIIFIPSFHETKQNSISIDACENCNRKLRTFVENCRS